MRLIWRFIADRQPKGCFFTNCSTSWAARDEPRMHGTGKQLGGKFRESVIKNSIQSLKIGIFGSQHPNF